MPNNETAYEKIFTYNPITNLQQLQAEADNFKKLFGVANLCADVLQDYERDGWLVTFNKKGTAENIWLLTIVNKSTFFAYAVLIVQKKNWLGKISGYVMEVGFSDEQKNSGEIFTKKSNADYDALFVTLWQGILKDAELGVHYYKLFHKTVDAPKAYNWFSLPIVTEPEAEKIYSGYEESSDEWRGFWNDEYMFSFRQKNKETQAPAILQIARKILVSDVFDTRSYRIWFIESGESFTILLKYNSSQEGKYDDRYQSINGALVFPFDWGKYKEAIDWYLDAAKLIEQANQFYLEDKEDNYQNNLPLIERDAEVLLRDFADELFFNEALFGHAIERLTFGNYYKQTEKQFVSFEQLSLSAHVIWNEDKTIGYGFNQQEGKFTQLQIILTENGKTETAELFIYHLNKEKNIVHCYHLPKGKSIDSNDLPKFFITKKTEKQIIVSMIEQFHNCEDYFETKDEEMNDAANTQKVFTKPYETVTMDGIVFKVIDIHHANSIIKDLTDLEGDKLYEVYTNRVMFPLYEENTFFLLAEEDVEAEGFSVAFNNDEYPDIFILGFIFLKNLTTQKYVEGCEIDVSPVLIVLGKVTTNNLMVVGNTHYIGKGIECETIWGMYNHGSLYVKGETEAHLIYADDMEMHFEKFKGLGVAVSSSHGLNIFTTTHLPQDDGTTLLQEYNVLNTHKLSDAVADEYIFISEYGEEMISDDGSGKAYEAMMQGESIIDWNKEGRVMYGHFISYFQKKIGALLQLPAMQQNGFWNGKRKTASHITLHKF